MTLELGMKAPHLFNAYIFLNKGAPAVSLQEETQCLSLGYLWISVGSFGSISLLKAAQFQHWKTQLVTKDDQFGLYHHIIKEPH